MNLFGTGLSLVWAAALLLDNGIDREELDDAQSSFGSLPPSTTEADYASPTALAVTPDGGTVFIACATAHRILAFDTARGAVVRELTVPESPSGLVLSPDGNRLYVTCAAAASVVAVLEVTSGRMVAQLPVGHTAMSPVVSRDGKTLYVCNRFNDDVSVIDLTTGQEVGRIPVEREPVAAALTPDGRRLLVVNHLHAGVANAVEATLAVSVIETTAARVTKKIRMPLGSSLGRGLAVSPDGQFAAVTHLRSLFWLTTSAVELGRMNCNALTVLDLGRLHVLGTILLDQTCRGAANPWAVAWTPDGRTIAASQAGTHEISLVDAPRDGDPWNFLSLELGRYAAALHAAPGTPKEPLRVRERIPLPGEGPRALAVAGSTLYVANYFSDNLCRIDLVDRQRGMEAFPIWKGADPDLVRRGEMLFNDARLCSQGWQSCASCHDADARTDALNWDLLNDGAGNPKNTKSLLWAHDTAPAMAIGIRSNAQVAVRAGIHHILFTEQPDEVPRAIDAYLASLRPLQSPYLLDGRRSPAAERGELLFLSTKAGCVDCHPPPLWTDQGAYDVGTGGAYKGMWGNNRADPTAQRFDTPTLVELWRTRPYLHDGSAATVRDVLTKKNSHDAHGRTSELTPSELADLIAFLQSL